jgi:hypothetical protein
MDPELEKWRDRKETGGFVFAVAFIFMWLDGVAYFAGFSILGGGAIYGDVIGNRYYLGPGHSQPLFEVSRGIYLYSYWHELSIAFPAFLALVAFIIYSISCDACRARERIAVVITPDKVMVNGDKLTADQAAARIVEAWKAKRDIRIEKKYPTADVPLHAIAIYRTLVQYGVMVPEGVPYTSGG